MTGHTNLYRRGATYYFRARVPKDIVDTYGKDEEKFSLKTKDKAVAVKAVRLKSAEVELKFSAHRRSLEIKTKPLSEVVTPQFLKDIHDMSYWGYLAMDEGIRTYGVPDFDNNTTIPFKEKFDTYERSITEGRTVNKKAFASGDLSAFTGRAIWYLNHFFHADANKNTAEVIAVAREMQRAYVRALESIEGRNEGSVVDTPELTQNPLRESPVASNAPLLSEVLEPWIKDKSRVSWTKKTAQDNRRWVAAFISLCGDKPLNDYRKADAMAFKELLLKLPPNCSKKKAFKGLSMADAAEKAQRIGEPPMSAKNAKKAFQYVGSLFRWSFAHYDELEKNIFDGITIEVDSNKRKERDKFSLDDLNTIFNSPLYTGCKSKRDIYKEGTYSMKGTARYWVPLLGLYTGARLGELLQLYVSDVKEEGGIHYLDINDNGGDKNLKTRTSERRVPIHQTLVDLGFLGHVQMMREQGRKRVFPDVKLGSAGTYSDPFSRFFSRYLEELQVKTSKKSFHSFRHNFKDACRVAGAESVMDVLQGHSEKGMSSRYGDGYELPRLNEGLQKVHYSGLELPT